MSVTDAEGTVISNTVQEYNGMGEAHVVAVESAVAGVLVEMGVEKLAAKDPEAAKAIRESLGKGKV